MTPTVQLTLEGAPWTPERPATGSDEALVLACLETDAGLAWSRAQLSYGAGMADRRVRKAVESLRKAGWPIISSSHTIGYWLSHDQGEIEGFLRELSSRVREQAETALALGKTLQRLAIAA